MAPTSNSEAKSVNANRSRKRVEAETVSVTLKRAKNGSAFTTCDGCKKSVAVALISFHDCGLDKKIKMKMETNYVEIPTETVAKKPVEKSKKAVKEKEPSVKKSKKQRDPSKPKKPTTAFFLFMEDFRKTFKEANPDNKKVAVVAKEGGEKWKSMTEEEKKPYTDKFAELKVIYQEALENPKDEAEKEEKETVDVIEDVQEKESSDVVDVDDNGEDGSAEKDNVGDDE